MTYVEEWDLNPTCKDKFRWMDLVQKKIWWWLFKETENSFLENLQELCQTVI